MKLKHEAKHCVGDCEYELTETYEDETCVLDMVVVDEVNVFTCKHCGQTKHEYA